MWGSGTTRLDQTNAKIMLLHTETQRNILNHVDHHDRPSQPDAAACIHSAARGSGQAGTPSLVASACAPSRTRPSRVEPPLDRARHPLQLHAPNTPQKCSGVSAFCGERQRSGRHPLSRRRCVRPLPHLRPPMYHTSTVPASKFGDASCQFPPEFRYFCMNRQGMLSPIKRSRCSNLLEEK